MKTINEIISSYTAGKTDLEETNAALEETGAGYHLDPDKNTLTEDDIRETVVGHYPEQASGWGLLDTGTGILDKVHMSGGRLDHAVNEVLPDGTTNMLAYVTVCGKTYEVLGDTLAEVRVEEDCDACKVPQLPRTPDMRRRMDLAGQTVDQQTKSGTYAVTYDEDGYAVRATRVNTVEEEN